MTQVFCPWCLKWFKQEIYQSRITGLTYSRIARCPFCNREVKKEK